MHLFSGLCSRIPCAVGLEPPRRLGHPRILSLPCVNIKYDTRPSVPQVGIALLFHAADLQARVIGQRRNTRDVSSKVRMGS